MSNIIKWARPILKLKFQKLIRVFSEPTDRDRIRVGSLTQTMTMYLFLFQGVW